MRNFRGIYIGFRDRGICGNIHSVAMHYYKCPQIGGEQMVFPATVAPNSSTSVLRNGGSCIPHSETDKADDNFILCYTNGTAKFFGRCYCSAGYQSLSMSQCNECPPKTFKDTKGNFPCKVCGKNVKDGKLPRTSVCECIPGFYRPTAKKNVYVVDCEAPPTGPRRLTATTIGSTWALITWIPPIYNGTGDRVEYEISYDGYKHTTRNLYFNATGLKAFTYCTLKVSSINNVTKAIDQKNGSMISFKTSPGLPSEVRNLMLIRNVDVSVTVYWQEPAAKGGSYLRYFVVVNGDKGRYTSSLNYTVYQKQNDVTYKISVKSHTSAGFSPEKIITFIIIGKAEGYEKAGEQSTSPENIALYAVASLLLLMLVLLLIWNFKLRKQVATLTMAKRCTPENAERSTTYMNLQPQHLNNETPYYASLRNSGALAQEQVAEGNRHYMEINSNREKDHVYCKV